MSELGSVANVVFEGVKNLTINFVYLLLTPIVDLIFNLGSSFSPFLDFIESVLTLIKPYVVYAIDMSFITPTAWAFIILCITLKLTYGILIWSVKLITSWYHYLVP